MNVILYKFKYEKSDIVKNLANDENYTCTLRFPTNILNPIIRIQLDEPTTTIKNWSYAYIEDFGKRYYFVENVVAFTNNIYDLYLHVDVLFTYIGVTNGILRNDIVFVERNEYSYDLMIKDSRQSFKDRNRINYYTPTNLLTADFNTIIKFKSLINNVPTDYHKNRNFLITVTRKNTNEGGGADTPYCDESSSFDGRVVADSMGFTSYLLNKAQAFQVINELLNDSQKASYVRSIKVLPFMLNEDNLANDNTSGDFYYGNTHFTINDDIYGGLTMSTLGQFKKVKFASYSLSIFIPQSFNNNNDYSKLEIYIPCFGWYTIDKNYLFTYEYIHIGYIIDTLSDSCRVHVYFNTSSTFGGKLVLDQEISMGISIPINTSNMYENQQKKNSIATQATLGTVTSALMILGGIALSETGVGIPMFLGGLGSLAGTLGSSISQGLQIYDYGTKNVVGNNSSLYEYDVIVFREITKLRVTPISSAWLKENGLPSQINSTISSLKGYTELGKCEFALENTKEEEELEELLMKGVHFPTGTW